MSQRRRYWVIAGAIGSTLLIIAGVAHAPGTQQVMPTLAGGGTIRALPPAEEAGRPHPEVSALVDEVMVRAGALPKLVSVDGAMSADTEPSDASAVRLVPEEKEIPWRHLPTVGTPGAGVPLTVPRVWAEPVTIVHARPEGPRELPPLKVPVVVSTYAFGALPPRRSERLLDRVDNDPIDATVPNALTPPGVGGAEGPGVPVPEPTTGLLPAIVFAHMIRSRRRR